MVTDVQFVTDAQGRRTAVLMPIEQYEALQEQVEDQQLAKAARESLADNERIPWEQAKADLVAEGTLDA